MKGGIEKEIKSLEERRNKYLKERTLKKDMAKKISWLLIMMLAAFLLIVGIVTANRKEDLHAATRANHGFWYAKVLVIEKGADPKTAKPLLEFGAKYTSEFPMTQYGYLYDGGPHYYMPPLRMDLFKKQLTLVGGTDKDQYQKDPNSIKFADSNGLIQVKKIFISTSSTRPTSRTQMKEYNSYADLPRSPKTPSGMEKYREPVDQPRFIEIVLETTDGGDPTMPPVTPPPGTAEPQPLTFTLTNEQAEPLAGVRFMLESLRSDKKTWSQFSFMDSIINNNNNGKGLSEQWDTNNKNYYITDSKGQITLTPAAVKEMMSWGDKEDNDLAFRFRQVSQASGYQAPPPYSGAEIEETNSKGKSLNGFVTQPVMITSEVMNERAAQGWTSMNTGLTNKLSDTTNLLINPAFVQVKGGEAIPSWNMYFSNFYVDNINANPIDLSNKSLYDTVGLPGQGNFLAVTKETLNNNIGPWRLSGSGINNLVVDQPKGTANSAGLISIYNHWAKGEYQNPINGTAAMLVTGDWNTISAPNTTITEGISLIFGQVINVTPGKTYRFGTTSDVWERKVNESDAPKMDMNDASVQVRISPEQKIAGEGGVNYFVTNEPMTNYGLYTTYKVPEGVNQVTLSIRLKLRKYAQWNMLANLKDAYFEEMEDGGTGGGGGNGGGTGGGGTSQKVTVKYYRDGTQYGNDETKTGALGSSWTVDSKNWSGYTFDHAEVTGATSWTANQIPFSGYFSTTATTVKVYYKSNTVEPTHDYNIKPVGAPFNYGTVDVGSPQPPASWYNKKVALYDGNTKIKDLTVDTDFTVLTNYDPVWSTINQTPGQKSTTVKFRTTSSLDNQYPGLSKNDSTSATLNVNFQEGSGGQDWTLKVTPKSQKYTTTSSQPSADARKSWVDAQLVNSTGMPKPYAEVESVTITSRQSAIGSSNWTNTSSVDMSIIGTLKYRVTVVVKDTEPGAGGKTYTKTNVEVPVTITGISYELNVTTNPKTYNQYTTVNVNDSWLKSLVNVSLKDSSNPVAPPTQPASYEVTLVSPTGSTVDTSTARVITYTVNITAKDENGTSYTKNGVEIPITIKEVTSYKLEVDPQTIDLWEGDSQPDLKEVFKGAVKVVVDQGTAKPAVTLSDNQYDIAVTSTWNNSATLPGAPRTFTVKVTPTAATASDYHGLKEVSGPYLLVNFKVITYELQATGIPQEYWSNDLQPSAADRLKWVKDVKVKPSNTEAVDVKKVTAVDITGIKGGSATNQVDMTKLGETIIYLVTVTAENPLKNNESIKVENIEIPITIIAPPTYQLKINVVDVDGNPINYESVSAPFGFARESSTSWDTAATTTDNVITFTNGLEIQSSYQIEQSHVLAEQTDQQSEDITDNTGSVFPPGTGIKPPPGLTQELHTSSLIETYPWNKQEPSAAFRISRDESVLSYGSKTYDTNTTDSIELADGLKAKYDKDNHILELTITNDQGELVLAVPDLLFQQGMPGALKDQILGRKEDEQNPWSVKVKDTLQTNQNWNLEAKLTDPFTLVGENREIKDILVYKETPAATQQLMQVGQAIDVLDKSKAGEPDANQYYVKTWDKQAGFLLNIDKQKSMGIKEGEYTATIEFTLKDAD